MIIKFSKIISCTSQHPSYPATNLLEYSSSKESSTWLCAKSGILESEIIFELEEPSPIIGVDIGNARCCSVRITGSTKNEPDNWVTIIEHEFMSRSDAEDDKFRDQVQLFTKKELKQETITMVFSMVKVTCMQPANPKVLFGLSFLIFRTKDKSDTEDIDALGRFKMKRDVDNSLDKFKEKYLQQIRTKKQSNFKNDIAKQIEKNRIATIEDKKDDSTPRKRPSLNLTRSPPQPENSKTIKQDEQRSAKAGSSERPSKRIKIDKQDNKEPNSGSRNSVTDLKKTGKLSESQVSGSRNLKKDGQEKEETPRQILSKDTTRVRPRCSLCLGNEENVLCKTCNLLIPEKEKRKKEESVKQTSNQRPVKPVKDWKTFFEGVSFALSGYKNPERDDIRRKAIAMGGKYINDTDRRNHGCTHLICAFKNTPKYKQLKGDVKIISHRWIEDCYDKKIRFPWRRYALDSEDKDKSESEEEIADGSGAAQPPDIYNQDTDSDY